MKILTTLTYFCDVFTTGNLFSHRTEKFLSEVCYSFDYFLAHSQNIKDDGAYLQFLEQLSIWIRDPWEWNVYLW